MCFPKPRVANFPLTVTMTIASTMIFTITTVLIAAEQCSLAFVGQGLPLVPICQLLSMRDSVKVYGPYAANAQIGCLVRICSMA